MNITTITLIVAGIAFDRKNWLALAMCAVVYATALYFAFLLEQTKKRYDMQTYREIKAFMEGSSSLEEIRAQRSPLPQGVDIARKLLAGMCVGAAVGLLMTFLMRLF